MKLGKINAVCVYVAWAALLAFILNAIYGFLIAPTSNLIFNAIIITLMSSALLHVVLSFFVRCPHCNKQITTQGFKAPHPNSEGDWSRVVAKWFTGSVVCIHCGQEVSTNDL